ncbi:multidrug efflux system outer membrane protein [Prosthecobacter fusiformis]|uniref:Multidrug efflux system outer membrane protein n=1 Tax=Prosthecobacter fusiformis TaxID=48464 RepID=A0A4R7S368_9BACT|nr:efflux transporter outer membrane subunit [Prosthecobacter fusiformis]TDU72832.1 multidrug efflux system outer membrane protein [Prosthecobacter fusiformis]
MPFSFPLLTSSLSRHSRIALMGTVMLTAASCTVGPDYERPLLGLSSRWKQTTDISDLPVPDQWWTLFKDRTLNGLVERALVNNQDLRGSEARVAQARALTGVERADWFPQLNLQSTATFNRLSQNNLIGGGQGGGGGGAGGIGGVGGGGGGIDLERDSYSTLLGLNYEVDLWGRVRRRVEGARAREDAAFDNLTAQRLVIAAEVARSYFLGASLDNQEQVLRETISLREEARSLQQSRFEGGLANEMDVARARTELELAKNDLAAIERQRGAIEHSLAVLCGEIPAEFRLGKNRRLPAPPRVPAGLPSSLLQRRPDIRAAEQNLRAANADIGVAKASFYPAFSLTGSGGLESLGAEDFLEWNSRVGSIGPQVTLPIFQGGRLRGNLRASQARYDESLASYKQTILTSLREVEDAMLDLKGFSKQRAAVAAAVASSQETSRLSRLRYEKGLASYFEVVDADRIVLTTRLTLAQLDGQRLTATVQMLRAIGGGWAGVSK